MQEYLEKHNLKDIEDIAQHIVELKRNTVPNLELISSLCSYLFSAENENKVRANFYRYENNNSPITEVKHFKTLDDAQLYFIDSVFEEVFYYDESEFILGMETKYAEKTEKQGVREQVLQEIKQGYSTRHKSQNGESHKELIFKDNLNLEEDYPERLGSQIKRGKIIDYSFGVKETQTETKPPVFTYCKVNKNALEALSLRALYGHDKYLEFDADWQNFTRVPDGDFEYGNAEFRHALGIGGEETEEEHLVAAAWNAVARLEIYLRNKLNKS